MKHSHGIPRRAAGLLSLLAAWAAPCNDASAQQWVRGGSIEVFGSGQFFAAEKVEFSDFGVRLDIDKAALGGFGVGYNLTDHFGVNFEILLGESDFRASGPGPNLVESTFIGMGKLNFDYYVLATRFTPVVTGGLGFLTFSSEIENADPVLVCYYDGWWGYVCGYERPTYTETDIAYNVGAGFRWDILDHLFMKLIGGATWVKLNQADGHTPIYTVTFSIGGSF